MSNILCRDSFNGTIDIKLEDGHCFANCGHGEDWLTVYIIETDPDYRNKGECQKLLKALVEFSTRKQLKFGIYCPMNDAIRHIVDKLQISIYE